MRLSSQQSNRMVTCYGMQQRSANAIARSFWQQRQRVTTPFGMQRTICCWTAPLLPDPRRASTS
eukprot:1671186-Amphidinium_carterae.1